MKPSDPRPSALPTRELEAERFVPDRDGPELAYEHVHRYLLAARLLEGMNVLDLAAGSGYGADLLERAGCRVTAVDLEMGGLAGRRRAACADARRLPFGDESFDAVVCFEAIEHIEDPEALVSEVQRVLRGRSVFLVSTPDRSIYSDRAGHRNPYHLAEMNRAEFAKLLGRHFTHVRLSGQGLWAGSWVTSLDDDGAGSVSSRRTLDALRWRADETSDSVSHPGWASPGEDELPVPVYLLAACSNSTQGWNRIKRRWSTDSVLHDSSQWLLAQYEQSMRENSTGNLDLQNQIEQARLAQLDLTDQVQAARARIDKHDAESNAARASMAVLEDEIRRSRGNIDRQAEEIRRARLASNDLQSQLTIAASAMKGLVEEIDQARAAIALKELDLEAAGLSVSRLEGEIDQARAAIALKDLDLEAAGLSVSRLEGEIDQARATIDRQREDLDRAKKSSKNQEAQIEAARAAQVDLLAQIDRARAAHRDLDAQLENARSLGQVQLDELKAARAAHAIELERARGEFDAARSTILDFEVEISAARTGARDLENQIELARRVIQDKDREIESARATVFAQNAENQALRTALTAKETAIRDLKLDVAASNSRIADLVHAQARFGARIGHRLADWVDVLRGRRS